MHTYGADELLRTRGTQRKKDRISLDRSGAASRPVFALSPSFRSRYRSSSVCMCTYFFLFIFFSSFAAGRGPGGTVRKPRRDNTPLITVGERTTIPITTVRRRNEKRTSQRNGPRTRANENRQNGQPRTALGNGRRADAARGSRGLNFRASFARPPPPPRRVLRSEGGWWSGGGRGRKRTRTG